MQLDSVDRDRVGECVNNLNRLRRVGWAAPGPAWTVPPAVGKCRRIVSRLWSAQQLAAVVGEYQRVIAIGNLQLIEVDASPRRIGRIDEGEEVENIGVEVPLGLV